MILANLVQSIGTLLVKTLSTTAQFNTVGQLSNPEVFNQSKIRIIGTILGGIISIKINPNSDKSISKLYQQLQLSVGCQSIFYTLFNEITSEENSILNIYFEEEFDFDVSNLSLCDLYEALLSIELECTNNKVTLDFGKSYRNSLGSYYTPNILAKNCVELALDSFIENKIGLSEYSKTQSNPSNKNKVKNLLLKSKLADFSSGGGKFLVELVNYFKNYVSINTKLIEEFYMNIFALDVDFLALEVAKFELLSLTNSWYLFKKINTNYLHGNPLLISYPLTSASERIEIFSKGFIYHEKIGIPFDLINKMDVIVGNPPWEKIRLEEKSFFKQFLPSMSSLNRKNERHKVILSLQKTNPHLYSYYLNVSEQIEKAKKQIKRNTNLAISSSGELNTYALFTELAFRKQMEGGVVGLLLKSAVVISPVNKLLFQYLVNNNKIFGVFDFINKNKIFAIDSRERFCFLMLRDSTSDDFYFVTNMIDIENIQDRTNWQVMNRSNLELINPVTKMLPNTQGADQMSLLLKIIRNNSTFSKVFSKAEFGRIVHFTSHSDFIYKKPKKGVIPILEGKFIHQFDGRYADFSVVSEKNSYGSRSMAIRISLNKKKNSKYITKSRFYIGEEKWKQLSKRFNGNYMLAWRSLTSATNSRTCISTILPFEPASQSIQFLQLENNLLPLLCGIFNSITFDYVLRIKLSGIDLTQTIIKQMPTPSLKRLNSVILWEGRNVALINLINDYVLALLSDDERFVELITTYITNKTLLNDDYVDLNFRRLAQNKIDLLVAFAYKISLEQFCTIIKHFDKHFQSEELDWMAIEYEKLLKLN